MLHGTVFSKRVPLAAPQKLFIQKKFKNPLKKLRLCINVFYQRKIILLTIFMIWLNLDY